VGVLAAAVVALARSGLHGWVGAALALLAFGLLASRRAGNAAVLLGSALLGILASFGHVRF
jgi:hypothetical protein